MDGGSLAVMDVNTTRIWVRLFSEAIEDRVDELNRLDAAIGDGDFGASMHRGMSAVGETVVSADTDSIGGLLTRVGTTLVSVMGGTSGPLVGTLFLRMGMTLADANEADTRALAEAFRAGADGVMALGQAAPGDKTMIDSLMPAVVSLEGAGDAPLGVAVHDAAMVAQGAAEATSALVARRGRASYVGGGGVGHVDPGAVGVSILFSALDLAVNASGEDG